MAGLVEKKIFKFLQCDFFIHNDLPLEKGGTLHLNKIESPSNPECFVSRLAEIGPVVFLEKEENVKSLRQQRQQRQQQQQQQRYCKSVQRNQMIMFSKC